MKNNSVQLPRTSRRSASSGFTLVEVLIAMAIFMLVMLTIYQVYERSRSSYQRGQNQAEMIQSVRVGFEQMVGDIRMAGFEFDLDGTDHVYPSQADEPIEFVGAHAIIVRGNLDFDDSAAIRGREPGLEWVPADSQDPTCCPVVTTANDEIVGYALGKSEGTQPTGTIAARFDLTGTQDASDGLRRDATATDLNVPSNEEAVSVGNLELADAPAEPPYVLYRFTWDDAGNLVKVPLVDNIRSLRFTYYGSDGAVIAPMGGADGNGNNVDRDIRWDIRRVKVELQGMEPERDLRYVDYSDTNPISRKRRKFLLQEDVAPPNLGKRGVVDKSLQEVEPVTNVAVCTGECRAVRVSWEPSPSGPTVVDHVINLYSGAPPHAANTLLFSDIRVGDFDASPAVDVEYTVFTSEQDPDLINGTTVYAQVIARDMTGQESLPAESNDNPTASARFGTIVDAVRPEAPSLGVGSGYDESLANWPNARKDNSSTGGAIQIVTDPASNDYPQANLISVGFTAPKYALNRTGNNAEDWSTRDLGVNGAVAPLTCHREDSIGDNNDPDLRTPIEELPGPDTPTDPHPNVYIFRVSGSDPWNWDDDGSGSAGITEPRNFVPTKRSLYDFVNLNLASGAVSWLDTSFSDFTPDPGGNQYLQRFNSTGMGLAASGMGSLGAPRAVVPGEVYYYRFRVVDLCWTDTTTGVGAAAGSDGIEDSFAGDATPLAAWAVRKDYNQAATWKTRALKISPFYPPIRRNSGNDLDKPDQGTDDSDDYPNLNSVDTYALPGYAIPKLDSGGNYIKPAKPSEFYLAKESEVTNTSAIGGNGLRVVFNAAKQNEPPAGEDPEDVAYSTYELWRQAASVPDPTANQMNFNPGGSSTLVAKFRVNAKINSSGASPEKGFYSLLRYTLDSQDEGAPTAEFSGSPQHLAALVGKATDWANPGTDTFPYIYRLFTVQNKDFDDGIDTAFAERSDGSQPFLMPCAFYDQVVTSTIAPQTGGTPTVPVLATVTMRAATGNPPDPLPGCDDLHSGRLLAFRTGGAFDGDYLGTSDWKDPDTGNNCVITFSVAHVDQARRGWSGNARYEVEYSNASVNGQPGINVVAGCRVRSDLLGCGALANCGGSGGPPPPPPFEEIGCAADCGSASGGGTRILGTVGDTQVTLDPGDNRIMYIQVPISPSCNSKNFSLKQVEIDLQNTTGAAVPALVGTTSQAQIIDGITGALPRDLPSPLDYDGLIGGNPATRRLRWFNEFTQGGTPNYPVVNAVGAGVTFFTIKLTFATPLCNVRVTAFNFRVPYVQPAGTFRDLLCTQRNDDPDPPEDDANPGLTGSGRSGESIPSTDCACQPTCVNGNQGRCPFNDANNNGGMNGAPDQLVQTVLEAGPNGVDTRVRIVMTNNCPTCNLAISQLEFTYGCCCGRNCAANPANKRVGLVTGARIRQKGLPNIVTQIFPPTSFTETGGTSVHYLWNPLNGINIRPVDTGALPLGGFELELDFSKAMDRTQFTQFKLRIGPDMPDALGVDPTCEPAYQYPVLIPGN